MLVSSEANLAYLTGYYRAKGFLLFHGEWSLITDPVHASELAEVTDLSLVVIERKLAPVLKELLDGKGLLRIGIDGDLPARLLHDLRSEVFGIEWTLSSATVESLRTTKTINEIALLSENNTIAEDAFSSVRDSILTVGNAERSAAATLESAMRRAGADFPAFETLLLSGERTAIPHARADDRNLCPSEPILIDYGLRRRGYCTDTCKMAWLESVPGEQAELYTWLRDTLDDLLSRIQPGMRGGEVDMLWRRKLMERGLEEACPHAIGHGVGLEVHEQPYLMRGSGDLLAEGNVITLEPGIFFPGRYGIRIEKMAVVTEKGAVWLEDWEAPDTVGGS